MKGHIPDPRQPEYSICGRLISCEVYVAGIYRDFFTYTNTKGNKTTCATCAKIIDQRLK